jgi:hemerythrin-like domain-containing protein
MSAMMSFTNRINQQLHDEHMAVVTLLARIEHLVARHRRDDPPKINDGNTTPLLSDFFTAVETEIQHHFAFEESHLFTYLEAIGEGGLGAHLTEEHRVILPIGMQLAKLARAAATQGFDQASWNEFRPLAQEFYQLLLSHVQKEEMGLLPLLEENIDADADARFFQAYVENA